MIVIIIIGLNSQFREGILIAQVPEKWLGVNTKVSPERPPEISKLPGPHELRKFVFCFLAAPKKKGEKRYLSEANGFLCLTWRPFRGMGGNKYVLMVKNIKH